ncbi:unnamed protein product, partial [Scytosiphon promiscuus]
PSFAFARQHTQTPLELTVKATGREPCLICSVSELVRLATGIRFVIDFRCRPSSGALLSRAGGRTTGSDAPAVNPSRYRDTNLCCAPSLCSENRKSGLPRNSYPIWWTRSSSDTLPHRIQKKAGGVPPFPFLLFSREREEESRGPFVGHNRLWWTMSIPRMREGPSMQLQTAGSTGSTEEGRLSAAAGSRRDAASTIPEDLPGDAAAEPPPPPRAAAAAQESAAAGDKDGGGSGGGGGGLGDGERGTVLPSLGAEVKSEDNEIHHYAQAGDVEEVRRCLLGGVNKVDEVDELGCTPLHLAGAMGHTDVVRLLVEEHGAAVDARDGARCTALHAASEGGYPVVVEMLLRLGAEIDARNSKQQTPLHYACGYGQVDAVHQLVIRGASAGVRDGNGNTPLHLACREGGADVVRLLLANGAPVDALNHRGRRPLHLACRNGRLEAAVTLLDHRADPSGRDANGMQALDMIGAGRRIPQGLRLDLVHTLERYQMGEYAMSRRPLSSTKSLRPMWRERDSNSAGTPRAPFGPLGTAIGAAAMAPAAASSAAGGVSGAGSLGSFETAAGSTRYPRRGFFAHGDSSIDGYSTGGASFWGGGEARVPEEGGGVGGPLSGGAAAAAAAAAAEAAAAAGMTTARGGPLSSRSGDRNGRRVGGGGGGVVGGGRSPRWTVGAAVAGRLEEMRARELGASLRAKVQENEAMKRYVDSVTEEMRALQLRVSRQSSPGPLSSTLPPPPPPPLSPSSFASAVGGAHLPRRAERGASPSIAEMVARGVYGIDGIVGRQQ